MLASPALNYDGLLCPQLHAVGLRFVLETLKDSCNSALYILQLDTPVSILSIRPPDLHQRRTKYRYRISGVREVT